MGNKQTKKYIIRGSYLQGLGYIMVANVVLLTTDVIKHKNTGSQPN